MALDYIEDKDIAGNAAGSIIDTAKNAFVSTGADLLSTIWNSTVGNLGGDDISTRDILARTDKNALSFYDEHKEGVETASFMAGLIAPQAATLKLLGMVKNGASVLGKTNGLIGSTANVLTGTKAQATQAELRALLEAGKYDTKTYSDTMRKLYYAKITENAFDAAIFEGVTVGMLNAHPYMEDYMESPVTNFVMWAGIGAAIGAPLGMIAAKTLEREALAGPAFAIRDKMNKMIVPVNDAMPNAAKIQTLNITIANGEALVRDSKDALTKGNVEAVLLIARGEKEKRIDAAASWLMPDEKGKESPFVALRPAVRALLSQQEMMGVDKIKVPKMNFVPKTKGENLTLEVEMLEKPTKEVAERISRLENALTKYDRLLSIDSNTAAQSKTYEIEREVFAKELDQLRIEGSKLKTVFYRPSTGDLFDRNAAGASALAVDLHGYKPVANDRLLHIPRGDWHLENAGRGKPSARVDADYINALMSWNKADLKKVEYYGIAPTDLASLNGATSWLIDKAKVELTGINFNLTSNLPSFAQTQRFIESGAAGVKPGHLDRVRNVIASGGVAWREQGISRELDDALAAWIHGASDITDPKSMHIGGSGKNINRAISALSRGMDIHLTGLAVLSKEDAAYAKLAKEMWEKGAKLRAELAKEADAEGYIRLYRGTDAKLKTHRGLESYSPVSNQAQKFGTAELYRIHVDNIVGTVGKGRLGEYEVLVTKPHQLPGTLAETGATTKVSIPNAGSKNTVNGLELIQHYIAETERQIKQMIGDTTFSAEEIAARLNTTKEAVLLVGAGRNLDEIPNWRRYTNVDAIETEYLNPKNKILALQGNPNTIRVSQMDSNLDQRFLGVGQRQFIEHTAAGAKNKIADEVLNLYNPLDDAATAKAMRWQIDQLGASLGEIDNVLVGSPFFQSLDQALRHIQAGPLVTFLGKEAGKLGDRITKRLLTPIANGFKGLGQNKVSLTEFLVADNKLLSLKGWKGMRTEDGTGFHYFVQRETQNIPDATGKKVLTKVEVPVKNADGSVYYIKTAEAANAIKATFETSSELLGLHNLNRKIRGEGALNDLGVYMPPPNLTNKFFSYVFDNTGKARPQVLYADTAKELAGLEKAYEQAVIKGDPTLQIITKDQQELFNHIHGYMDGDPYMTAANVQLRHAGASASAVIASDARRINEIMDGFNHQILTATRKFHEMYLHDITQKLDIFSKINQRHYASQPLRGFFKEKGKDAAMTVKNGILGVNNLDQFTTWKTSNEFLDMAIVKTSRAIDATFDVFKKSPGSPEHWEALNKDLTQAGIKTPFESFQLYEASLIGSSTVNSKRLVAAQNGFLGTMMLRFLEMGHPLVNAISLPILTSSAIMSGLPKTFLENGAVMTLPLRLPMDAMRFGHSAKGIEAAKRWEAAGDIDQVVRQFSDLSGELQISAVSKGAVNKLLDKVEAFQNSRAMEVLSTPSDFVEKWSRKESMNIGFLGAKHAYPGISDRAADIFAVAMSDRIIGNYHSQQRPVMFQGTAGTMLGLFQTYMLSFAQATYRHIEERQFKALAGMMLTQAGIFGTASWPGYNVLSQFIGEHLSNQNYDLTTGTYRAVGNPLAEVILYGLPSAMGPSLYTRGDIAPRIPTAMGDLAIVNSTVGMYNATAKMLDAMIKQPEFGGKLQGMAEGLSLQTLSRPIARASEIAMGESITRKGQTVATSDDVWSFQGVFSRMLSVRPLEEQVTRNALQLHSYYGAADHDNRQKAVGRLRTAIRAGSMPDDLVESVAQDYIRHGGSNKGWTSVMNEIMSRTEEGTSYDLLRKLEPDSPLRRMLKDTF